MNHQQAELPPLDVTEQDEAFSRQVFGGRPTSLVITRESQDMVLLRTVAEMHCRERQLLQALQQDCPFCKSSIWAKQATINKSYEVALAAANLRAEEAEIVGFNKGVEAAAVCVHNSESIWRTLLLAEMRNLKRPTQPAPQPLEGCDK